MHARILRFQTRVDSIDQASKLFNESVIPLCQKQKGYKGAFFIVDRETGNCVPVTLWDSEEDMLATEHNRFFQEQIVKFMNLFKELPMREGYEVVVTD